MEILILICGFMEEVVFQHMKKRRKSYRLAGIKVIEFMNYRNSLFKINS